VNIKESLEISESVSWDIKRDALVQITRAKDAKDYYKAVSLACTVFQYIGKQILFRSTGAVTKNIDLNSIIDALYKKNIIDKIGTFVDSSSSFSDYGFNHLNNQRNTKFLCLLQ
jgi:hypothetical protein